MNGSTTANELVMWGTYVVRVDESFISIGTVSRFESESRGAECNEYRQVHGVSTKMQEERMP